MDVKALAQAGVDSFNDRSFREKAKDQMDPDAVIIDAPTGRELHGPDGYVQLSEGFVKAIPEPPEELSNIHFAYVELKVPGSSKD